MTSLIVFQSEQPGIVMHESIEIPFSRSNHGHVDMVGHGRHPKNTHMVFPGHDTHDRKEHQIVTDTVKQHLAANGPLVAMVQNAIKKQSFPTPHVSKPEPTVTPRQRISSSYL